jgi:hypothetical protein
MNMNQSDGSRVSGRLLMRLRSWELTASRSILPTSNSYHCMCDASMPDQIWFLTCWAGTVLSTIRFRSIQFQICRSPWSSRSYGVQNILSSVLVRCLMGKSSRIILIWGMLKLTYIHMQIAPSITRHVLTWSTLNRGTTIMALVLA